METSKYQQRGAYHYDLYKNPGDDPYRDHVLDVVEKVQKFAPAKSRILDVGCGEGLFMRVLSEKGHKTIGFDIDTCAVSLGIEKRNDVRYGKAHEEIPDEKFDVAMCLDVLEHIDDRYFVLTVDHLKKSAPLVFIATPDRDDPHGHRVIEMVDILDPFFEEEWECVHRSTRYARNFAVLRKGATEWS